MVWILYLALIWILVIHTHWQIGVRLRVSFGQNSMVAAEVSDALAPLLADGAGRAWREARAACRVFYICASSFDFF